MPFTQQDLATRQWQAYVSQMIAAGKRREAILRTMLEANWPQQQARTMIQNEVSRIRGKSLVAMVVSASVGLLALAISVGTYQAASRAGGTYVIWWGGVLCGAVGFVYGLVKLARTFA